MIRTSNEAAIFKPEHTYVALSQEPNSSSPLEKSGVEHPDDNDEDNSNYSNSANHIHDVGLISKSRFSDLTLKVSSAFFYGICSFLITVINKIVVTSYKFPSTTILGVGQATTIIVILKLASLMKVVTIRRHSLRNTKLWILASLYFFNLLTGLGSTKYLPLPMMIALRRFSIAFTAIGEFYVLHVRQSCAIIWTIVVMIGGSLIAAISDITFSLKGYLLVMGVNLIGAANGVYTKKTINAREINKHEILFYNALLTIGPLVAMSCASNNLDTLTNYEHRTDPGFIISFLLSCVMAYLLMYSTVLCTHYNSALTTTIVGTLKNILTTFVGMYIGGDYRFTVLNFIGLMISLVGSLAYTYLTFSNKSPVKEQPIKI